MARAAAVLGPAATRKRSARRCRATRASRAAPTSFGTSAPMGPGWIDGPIRTRATASTRSSLAGARHAAGQHPDGELGVDVAELFRIELEARLIPARHAHAHAADRRDRHPGVRWMKDAQLDATA